MKTASIETVRDIKPHPNADRLELATVLGWQCIVRKGEFHPGEPVVFVAPDTILPDAEWSAFLKKDDKPIRLKTMKLRGQFSQGLVLKTSVLPGSVWEEGADVGGLLGVKKFEKEVPANLRGTPSGKSFPLHLAPKTDEDNYQSVPDQVAETLKHKCFASLKLDGSSCTIIIEDGKIANVCSRKIDLVRDPSNAFWKVALEIEPRLTPECSFVLQGELMGPGIQGNQLGLTEPKLFVYQVRTRFGWARRIVQEDICAPLRVSLVPFLFETIPGVTTAAELQDIADRLCLPGTNTPAEGIVVRPLDSSPSMGCGRPLGFKVVSRTYDSK